MLLNFTNKINKMSLKYNAFTDHTNNKIGSMNIIDGSNPSTEETRNIKYKYMIVYFLLENLIFCKY